MSFIESKGMRKGRKEKESGGKDLFVPSKEQRERGKKEWKWTELAS